MSRRFPEVPFDAERIRGFLGDREVLRCALLTEGACNSNYRILVGDEECVVRFYNRGSPEHDGYVLGLVRDVVPVPELLDAGPDWCVMQFLPGGPLAGSAAEIEAAARALARIGKIEFEAPGQILADGLIQPFPFGGLQGFFETWLAKAEVRWWIETPGVRGLEALLKKEASRIEEIDAESRLVHGDFNPSNILVAGGEITGVLDWEFTHSGSPYADLGNLVRHFGSSCVAPVSQAFEAEGTSLPDDWRHKAALVDLTAQLEFLTSTHSREFKQRCVRRVHATLGL